MGITGRPMARVMSNNPLIFGCMLFEGLRKNVFFVVFLFADVLILLELFCFFVEHHEQMPL